MTIKDSLKNRFRLCFEVKPAPFKAGLLWPRGGFHCPTLLWWQVYARLACSQAPQSQTISPPILGVWEAGDRKQAQALTLDPRP